MISASFLQQQSLFGAVDDRAMAVIVPLMRESAFAAGEVIVREGDEGDSLFILCSGTVEVLKACPAAEDPFGRRIAVLGVGDVFGEMELIDLQHRSATVRALAPVTLLGLSNTGLWQVYEHDPAAFTLIVMNLARELSRRLRSIDALAAGCPAEASANANPTAAPASVGGSPLVAAEHALPCPA